MPIYQYRCEECNEPFEVFVRSSSQQTNLACPKCGSREAKKEGIVRVQGEYGYDMLAGLENRQRISGGW